MARISLSDKVHVLTGQNNTGKSSLLQALQKLIYTIGFSRGQVPMSGGLFVQEDLSNGFEEELIAISVCFRIDEVSDWVDNLFLNTDECGMATRASVASLFMAGAFSDVNDKLCWINLNVERKGSDVYASLTPSDKQFVEAISDMDAPLK